MLLFLSDVAGSEILLILVFILIFFGSKSIPSLARTMGRTIRQIKDASEELQNEIKKSGMDMKNDLNLTSIIEETAQDIQRPLQQHAREIDEALRFEPPKTFEAEQNLLNDKNIEELPKTLTPPVADPKIEQTQIAPEQKDEQV
jgi:sec-independent protein translocase protein TatA